MNNVLQWFNGTYIYIRDIIHRCHCVSNKPLHLTGDVILLQCNAIKFKIKHKFTDQTIEGIRTVISTLNFSTRKFTGHVLLTVCAVIRVPPTGADVRLSLFSGYRLGVPVPRLRG